MPPTGSTGTFSDIQVSVTDGAMTTALPAFSITVTDPAAAPAPGTGTAKLSWAVPTQNVDGSELTDLAGYWIYFGTEPGNLGERLEIGSPMTTAAEVTGLAAGAWYFAMSSVNDAGAEGPRTAVVSKVL